MIRKLCFTGFAVAVVMVGISLDMRAIAAATQGKVWHPGAEIACDPGVALVHRPFHVWSCGTEGPAK